MKQMQQMPEKRRPERGFSTALVAGWAVLAAAGVLYGRWKGIPVQAAAPLLAAFLVEYPFYLVLAFPTLRDRFARRLTPYLLVVAVLPYLAASLGAAQFHWLGLARIAGLALVMALWHRVLPRAAATDIAFLALFPAALLGGYLSAALTPAVPIVKSQLAFLGHFILLVMAITVLMVGRGMRDTGYGFLPTRTEWRIGVLHYLYFVAVGLPVLLGLGAARWHLTAAGWWIFPTYLIAFLWVIALSEEFLVRGVLQGWLEDWTGSRFAALLIAAAVFGLMHIGFRGFPNWRWVLVAGILGLCCGRARNIAGGIRAGVVTHALAVATWRAFFS